MSNPLTRLDIRDVGVTNETHDASMLNLFEDQCNAKRVQSMLTMTPFGRPVLPEVNMMYARLRGWTGRREWCPCDFRMPEASNRLGCRKSSTSSTVHPSTSSSGKFCDVHWSRSLGPVSSSSRSRRRAVGRAGSKGTYAKPALRTIVAKLVYRHIDRHFY